MNRISIGTRLLLLVLALLGLLALSVGNSLLRLNSANTALKSMYNDPG